MAAGTQITVGRQMPAGPRIPRPGITGAKIAPGQTPSWISAMPGTLGLLTAVAPLPRDEGRGSGHDRNSRLLPWQHPCWLRQAWMMTRRVTLDSPTLGWV